MRPLAFASAAAAPLALSLYTRSAIEARRGLARFPLEKLDKLSETTQRDSRTTLAEASPLSLSLALALAPARLPLMWWWRRRRQWWWLLFFEARLYVLLCIRSLAG